MKTEQNARLACGDNKTLAVGILNPSTASIAGMTANYILARSAYDPHTPLVAKSTTSSNMSIITGAGVPVGYDALLNIPLLNDDTAGLDPGWYYHEAMVTLAGGQTITVMSGLVRLDPSHIASTL